MTTFLISGGYGFIGSNFIQYLRETYGNTVFIINIDKLTYASHLENIPFECSNNYKFFHADICNTDTLDFIFRSFKIDYIVNFAAESHVDRSIQNPSFFTQNNILGTQNLLEITRKYLTVSGLKHFVQVSTDEVYGSADKRPFNENDRLLPGNPYSTSKACADLISGMYFKTYGLPITITRCANNFGPNQYPEKLIPNIILRLLKKKPIKLYGDGLYMRNWIYVKDHCEAIDSILQYGRIGDIYNIGSISIFTNLSLIDRIMKMMMNIEKIPKEVKNFIQSSPIEYVDDRENHDRKYALDTTKIRKELHWEPSISFNNNLLYTINWYIDHQDRYESEQFMN